MSTIEDRLRALGLSLPDAPAPATNYVPYTISGKLLFVSGQVPFQGGGVAVVGQLGRDVSLEQGQAAARLCALNLLAQARAACGGELGRLARWACSRGTSACRLSLSEGKATGAGDTTSEKAREARVRGS